MSRSHEAYQLAFDISRGVLGTLTDVTLFFACFSAGYLLSSLGTRKGHLELRPLKFMLKNYPEWRTKLRNALHLAKREGLLKTTIDGDRFSIAPTPQGMERLSLLLPKLKRHATWSGSLWLVTYDIAEDRKNDREALRRFLLEQGYGKLQDSIYVAPFDPTSVVRDAVTQLSIKGEVLVSRMGEHGHIGEMSVQELIAKVYPLSSINDRYRRYLNSLENNVNGVAAPFRFLEFLAILKDDPQLPAELLPNGWSGQSAYKLTIESVLPPLLKNNLVASKLLDRIEFSL